MRFVFLFIVALAVGHAHADGPGGDWEQVEQQQQQPIGDYDEYYLEDDDLGGNQTIVQQNQTNITVIDNSVTINNYVMIDTNVFPNAPAILPMGPTPPPVAYCTTQPRPWGWTFFAVTYSGNWYPLAHVGDVGAYWAMRHHLYVTGQCPNP